jgi:hypothetical protein
VILLIFVSKVARIIGVSHLVLFMRQGLSTFLPRLALNLRSSASASQVLELQLCANYTWLWLFFLSFFLFY